ncbi:MAG: hypothetical protein Q7T82_12585 [Armatimonadota bacterium]|nr:hypothetical protein [Armatimonadota bacterium]
MSTTITPTQKDELEPTGLQEKKRPIVTARALILGTLLVPVNCYWMAVMELQWNTVDATCVSLFFHVVFLIFLFAIANRWLMHRCPRFAFQPAEILIIYIMLSIASAVAGRDTMMNLLPMLGFPFWFDDPVNKFSRFFDRIPHWLAPHDKAVLRGYYVGETPFYNWVILKAWLPVIGVWSAFIVAMLLVMLCVNVIVRRHWMDMEKLQFPIVFLPVQMAQDKNFFKSRMLWAGFLLPLVIQTVNGLNYLFPSVPSMHLKLQNFSPYMVNPPWNSMGGLPVGFYPFAIGLAFFLPIDLSFSCWFFYVIRKLEAISAVYLGYTNPGGWGSDAWPFCKEQGAGAWIGLCLFLVYAGRKSLKEIIQAALRGERQPDEIVSYRTAIIGVLLGVAGMSFFLMKIGMSPWLPPIYLAIFFLLAIGITRIRAELGPPAHELNWVNPENIVITALGTNAVGSGSLMALTYMFWFNRGYRSLPMPHQLEGMKIGRETHMEPRRLLLAMILASVIAIFAAFWFYLNMFYKTGEVNVHSFSTGIGVEGFYRLNDWTNNPRTTNFVALSWMSIGFIFTAFLMAMKSAFFWWPFHPAGFALANSYALEYWWSCLFVGWLVKFLIVRYGGGSGYRRALPFFAGLILGDYVAASLWSIVGWILGISVYRTFIF